MNRNRVLRMRRAETAGSATCALSARTGDATVRSVWQSRQGPRLYVRTVHRWPLAEKARTQLRVTADVVPLLPLTQLAKELGVHIRTLQAAARAGRLEAHFSVRSAFGRPIRSASRTVGAQFLATHYRCFSGQAICRLPLPTVPSITMSASGVCVSRCD
jgi:hypothetical protein